MNVLKTALVVAVGLATALPAEAASSVSVRAGNGGAVIAVTSDHGYDRYDRRGDRWDRRHRRCLDERQIERRLYRAGYVRAWDFRLINDRYFVHAVNRRGTMFALVIDAYDGDILRVSVVDRRGRWDRGDRW